MFRSLTKAHIVYHNCGSVYRLMEDLIGLGIEHPDGRAAGRHRSHV